MAYTKDDPRSALAAPSRAAAPTADGGIAAPQFLDFSVLPPDVVSAAGSSQWIVRGHNFVLIYSEPAAGDLIWKSTLQAEQVLLLIDEKSAISGTTGTDDTHEVTGPVLVVVPPGESAITGTGPIVAAAGRGRVGREGVQRDRRRGRSA